MVSDEGEELGTISDVLQTGANDVYVVSKDGAKDLLIPAIHACIQNVDVAAGQMEVICCRDCVKRRVDNEVSVLTLFPDMVMQGLMTSITGRAVQQKKIDIMR